MIKQHIKSAVRSQSRAAFCVPLCCFFVRLPGKSYADFSVRRSLSAIIAINSEFVGLPRWLWIV